jgi:hypothetical protein
VIDKEYEDRIVKAFPIALQADVREVVRILPFEENKVKLNDGQIHQVDNLIHLSELIVRLEGENLLIPYRIYVNEPTLRCESTLTDRQKAILNCIFLRHHNGYLREQRLKQLANVYEYWVIPFKNQLLGEYVYEILQVLDTHITGPTLCLYVKFIRENPQYWQLTESRMISYWNEYYRWRFPFLKEYIGHHIVARIKKNAQHQLSHPPAC